MLPCTLICVLRSIAPCAITTRITHSYYTRYVSLYPVLSHSYFVAGSILHMSSLHATSHHVTLH